VVGSYEDGNEPSVFLKGGEFFDQLIDYFRLEKDCAPWNSFHIPYIPFIYLTAR